VSPEEIRRSALRVFGNPSLIRGRLTSRCRSSGTLAALALTADCRLGIDLEQVRVLPDMQSIANQFFCHEESVHIMSLPHSERELAFFCCWTRKEALLKAVGCGLSMPLNSFQVGVLPESRLQRVSLANGAGLPIVWTLQDLSLEHGYASALAYQGRQRSLRVSPIIPVAEFLKSA
jgi:4'-phosphopantetheinyl transferase